MIKLDSKTEAELEAKLIEINKLDMKLHVARRDLMDSVCDALFEMLPRESEVDDVIKAAKSLKVFKTFDNADKKKIIKIVHDRLNI